jgi:hypothetical protein
LASYLDTAWEHLRLNSGDRYLPDVISLEDVAFEWPKFKSDLLLRISNDQYSLSHVDILDLPKDALNVRPLARLALEDRLVYDACVLAMAPTIDAAIPSNVYSYRWSKNKKRLYSPKGRWVLMQRRGRLLHAKNQDLLLLRTDVTSFYEYVNIEMLLSELRNLGPAEWSVELLGIFLSEFSNSTHAWGLPQGPDTSGILANLYLLPIDNQLRHDGFTHLRYSDDMMVFGPNWPALRRALIRINHMCRSRHLSLSANKTKIVQAHDVAAAFEDTSKDAVRYGIDIESPTSQDDLRSYFEQAISETPVSARDLRFSLNQLARIGDDCAVPWLLANMASLPHLAQEAIGYLRKFRMSKPEIDIEISAMLANKSFELYPSVERHIINYLVLESVNEQKALDACWSILYDQNNGQIVREFAARYVGVFCGAGDGARLRELFEREPSEHVRRAILIACFEAGDCPQSLLRSIARGQSRLSITARYLQSAPSAIPCPSMEMIW